jgi:2-succinyl-6-hydroxy-2,4-cyclohexadiene-1-carboxylate synthase
VSLAFDEYPNPGAPTLVLVHGFTQNGRCWGDLPARLAQRFRVLTVDAPGHGRTPATHDRSDLVEAARLIGEAGGRARYLGYSMGGRMCLQLACDRPDLVEQLVLVGATPGLADPAARAERRAADERLAGDLLESGLPAFLDRWLALPLFAGLTAAAAARPERLQNRPEGLASSLRCCGTGAQAPLWDRLDRLRMPVLLLAGALDAKFAAEARAMLDRLPAGHCATHALVEGAGHTAHLEQPDAFLATLERWWAASGPA